MPIGVYTRKPLTEERKEQLNILQHILKILAEWAGLLQKSQTPITPTPAPKPSVEPSQPLPGPIAPQSPKYLWDTPVLARHSVRVICDEEGLDTGLKNTLCATIGAESGWNIHAVRRNYKKDGSLHSTDWGICQWNDYYHGKEITPDEAMNNPEKAVRLMCAYWKRGQQGQWVAYKNGSFAKYL